MFVNKLYEELGVSEALAHKLEAYLQLILKWNQAYNLTAVRTPDGIRLKHFADSLAVIPYLADSPLLDVGSGLGVPGLVIAMARPNLSVTCLDSVGKKVRFMETVRRELRLDNVQLVHSRAEDFQSEKPFGQIIARGLASIDQLMAWTGHLLVPGGQYFAMKSQKVHQEVAHLQLPAEKVQVIPLEVPHELGARYLVRVES